MMTRSGRTGLLAVAGVLLLALGGASLAWACTPQARIYLSPPSGPGGSRVTVYGETWNGNPGAAPVEIRWNSLSGPMIGKSPAPAGSVGGEFSFAVEVQIPNVPDGVYYIVASQTPPRVTPRHEGQNNAVQRAAFEVVSEFSDRTEPGPLEEEGQPSRGQTTGTLNGGGSGSGGGAGQTSASLRGGDNASTDEDQSTTGALNGGEASSSSSGKTSTSLSGADRSAPVASRGSESVKAAPEPRSVPVTGRPSTVLTAAGPVFGGSIATGALDEASNVAAQPASRPAADTAAAAPSLSASSDLWSGFAGNGTAFSLTDPGAGVAGEEGSQLMTGMALLAAGLLVLFGGGVGAMRTRRRAMVSSRSG